MHRGDALMQRAGPVSPRERYLMGSGAGCPHECHPHPAVTAGGSLCASSLGTAGARPRALGIVPQEEACEGQATEG